MKLENYTVNAVKTFRGHDGNGFNANLLCDGKKVAKVTDLAYGGMLDIDWLDEKGKMLPQRNKVFANEKAFEAMVDEQPEVKDEFFPEGLKPDGDLIIGILVDAFENLRIMRRTLKKKAVFYFDEQVFEYNRPLTAELEIQIKKDNPEAVILNNLHPDQAIKLWMKGVSK